MTRNPATRNSLEGPEGSDNSSQLPGLQTSDFVASQVLQVGFRWLLSQAPGEVKPEEVLIHNSMIGSSEDWGPGKLEPLHRLALTATEVQGHKGSVYMGPLV